jgi:hypothetical protein
VQGDGHSLATQLSSESEKSEASKQQEAKVLYKHPSGNISLHREQ